MSTISQINKKEESDQQQFDALSKELAERELEIATLEHDLLVFEKRYAKSVGVLLAELDILEREIARELLRLNPDDKHQKGFDKAERKAQFSQDAVNDKTNMGEKEPYVPTDEIKNLFRRVAKTVHPDFGVNESERAFRTELMTRANIAYRQGDKKALEDILNEWENRDKNSFAQQEEYDETAQLKQKIDQIKVRLVEIENRINELKQSDLYKLMLKVELAESNGYDLLDEMTKELKTKIIGAKKLLDSLKIRES